MNLLFLLILASIVSVQTAYLTLNECQRALEKSFLEKLKLHHKGVKVELALPYVFETDPNCFETKTDSVKTDTARPTINDLPIDIQQHVLTFLTSEDLLKTIAVNQLYHKLSYNANYLRIINFNPEFLLKENWMNMFLGKFLDEIFENRRFNADDLLSKTFDILFNFSDEKLGFKFYERVPITLAILSFLYEYENGINSSLPLNEYDLYAEILKRLFDEQELPKSTKILNDFYIRCSVSMRLERTIFMRIVEDVINLKRLNPNGETIMGVLNFDPTKSIEESCLRYIPPFFQVLLLDLIIPLCDRTELIEEALTILECSNFHSQAFFDLLAENHLEILRSFNDTLDSTFVYSRTRKAFAKKFPRSEIIGLEYILTCDALNPFDVEEFKALNPDIPKLLYEFFSVNTMSLAEVDMIAQMKEAGMFHGIKNVFILASIESILTQSLRYEKFKSARLFIEGLNNGYI